MTATVASVSRETWDAVAVALDYPGPGAAAEARRASELLSFVPSLSESLAALASFLDAAPPGEAEERYTLLFDLSPVCTLHAGWHLFGESYERGALLAGLAGELRAAGVEPGVELPDFLPNLLRLLGALAERQDGASRESTETLVDDLLLPSLGRMAKALADSGSAWAAVVRELPLAVAPLGTGRPSALAVPEGPFAPPCLSSNCSTEVAADA